MTDNSIQKQKCVERGWIAKILEELIVKIPFFPLPSSRNCRNSPQSNLTRIIKSIRRLGQHVSRKVNLTKKIQATIDKKRTEKTNGERRKQSRIWQMIAREDRSL